jgi:hypothetical protein
LSTTIRVKSTLVVSAIMFSLLRCVASSARRISAVADSIRHDRPQRIKISTSVHHVGGRIWVPLGGENRPLLTLTWLHGAAQAPRHQHSRQVMPAGTTTWPFDMPSGGSVAMT